MQKINNNDGFVIVGYPVVTLGFGFKSYVGFRMRLRRQKEVQKENEYYYEFLREALPPGPVRDEAFNINPQPSPKPCKYFIKDLFYVCTIQVNQSRKLRFFVKGLTRFQKFFSIWVPVNTQQDWRAKLESAYSLMVHY